MDLLLHTGGILIAAALAAVLPGTARRLMLLLAAALLYGAIDWRFPPLLAAIIVVTWLLGLWLAHAPRGQGGILAACAVVLAPLAVYKYLPVWLDGLDKLLPVSGLDFGGYGAVLVPVGLSFYSFACCGYLIDLHRRNYAADRNIARLALFVSFYPTLLSGPIERYPQLAAPLWEGRRPSPEMVLHGLLLIAYGVFLKEVVGDRLGGVVDSAYNTGASGGWQGAAIAFVGFVLQLLADFGGYSLIAVGAGNLFGVALTVNFRQPLFAQTLTDFWQRWHISLTRWIGDYVYRPTALLLVKHTRWSRWWKEAVASYVTWIAMGLWHGAQGTYLLFGAVQASLMLAHKAMPALPGARDAAWRRGLNITATLLAVVLTFGIIRAASLAQYGELLGALLTLAPAQARIDLSRTALIGAALMLAVETVIHLRPGFRLRSVPLRAALIFGFVTATVLLGNDDARNFIYFRF